MKQLSVRFAAPAATASLASRVLATVVRRANRAPQVLLAKWRLYLNYCPECNSCAPELHRCDVCQADTKAHFAWNKDVEQTWWKRYAAKHSIAA